MPATLKLTARRENTVAAIRESFDLHTACWARAAANEAQLVSMLDDAADEYRESEPERYALLNAKQLRLLVAEARERFAAN